MIGCLSFNSLGGQSDISIHTSVKEAAGNVPGKGSPPYIFQSTPPRRRRRVVNPTVKVTNISIHASAKEATTVKLMMHRSYSISIHASAKEATFSAVTDLAIITISIHASAKEATRTPSLPQACLLEFQSTPPRRRRPQHIVILQLSCTYLVSTTFLSTIFSFISQYVVLFFLF